MNKAKEMAVKTAVVLTLLFSSPHLFQQPMLEGLRSKNVRLVPSDNKEQPNLISFDLKESTVEKLKSILSSKNVNIADVAELSRALFDLFPAQKKSLREQMKDLAEYKKRYPPDLYHVVKPEDVFKPNARCFDKAIFVAAVLKYFGHTDATVVFLEGKEYFKNLQISISPHAFVIASSSIIDPQNYKIEENIERYLADHLRHGTFKISMFSSIGLDQITSSLLKDEKSLKEKADKGIIIKVVEDPPWNVVAAHLKKGNMVKKTVVFH